MKIPESYLSILWYLLICCWSRTSLVCHLTQIGDFCDLKKHLIVVLIEYFWLNFLSLESREESYNGIISIYDIFLYAVEAEHHWCAISHKGYIGTPDLVHGTFVCAILHSIGTKYIYLWYLLMCCWSRTSLVCHFPQRVHWHSWFGTCNIWICLLTLPRQDNSLWQTK